MPRLSTCKSTQIYVIEYVYRIMTQPPPANRWDSAFSSALLVLATVAAVAYTIAFHWVAHGGAHSQFSSRRLRLASHQNTLWDLVNGWSADKSHVSDLHNDIIVHNQNSWLYLKWRIFSFGENRIDLIWYHCTYKPNHVHYCYTRLPSKPWSSTTLRDTLPIGIMPSLSLLLQLSTPWTLILAY